MLGVCVDTNVGLERGVHRRRASCRGCHGCCLCLRLLLLQGSGREADQGGTGRLRLGGIVERSWEISELERAKSEEET